MHTQRFRGKISFPLIVILLILLLPAFSVATPVLPGDLEARSSFSPQSNFYPHNPQAGDIIRISCGVMARGCVRKAFYAKIEMDGSTLLEKQIESPDPGCTLAEERPYPYFTWDEYISTEWKAVLGPHTVRCTVDSKSEVIELNENNNTKVNSLTVGSPVVDKIKDIKTKPPIPVPTQRVR